MALSNILREPRREVVETGIGLLALATILYIDYRFAQWATGGYVPAKPDDMPYGMAWGLNAILGFVILAAAAGALVMFHAFGDWVCDGLQQHWGLRLRPKQRY